MRTTEHTNGGGQRHLAAVKAYYLRDCRPLADFFAEAVERGLM